MNVKLSNEHEKKEGIEININKTKKSMQKREKKEAWKPFLFHRTLSLHFDFLIS